MDTYTPDAWVLLEIDHPKYGKVEKILAGWYGGFAGSDEWRISSGNKKSEVRKFEDRTEFPQESGTVYICYKSCQKMSNFMFFAFANFEEKIKKAGGTIKVTNV